MIRQTIFAVAVSDLKPVVRVTSKKDYMEHKKNLKYLGMFLLMFFILRFGKEAMILSRSVFLEAHWLPYRGSHVSQSRLYE